MDNAHFPDGPCVYILKTGKRHYKIGMTGCLQKRLASYRTHLPALFRVVRHYPTAAASHLEQALHLVFQHKRVKGEWFGLLADDLVICDNLARGYSQELALPRKKRRLPEAPSEYPLLNVVRANEKYLSDYSKVAEDIKLGLSTEEIMVMHEGAVSKQTIHTVRRLLRYQTPNATFVSKWLFVAHDLHQGMAEGAIVEKYQGKVSRATVATMKRIINNQLY